MEEEGRQIGNDGIRKGIIVDAYTVNWNLKPLRWYSLAVMCHANFGVEVGTTILGEQVSKESAMVRLDRVLVEKWTSYC